MEPVRRWTSSSCTSSSSEEATSVGVMYEIEASPTSFSGYRIEAGPANGLALTGAGHDERRMI
jgi:hypothetical protein